MFLGYNTNGFAHHDLFDALELLFDIGYRGVGITLDHHVLNPYDPQLPIQLARVREFLLERQMRSVIETGARYLLNPRVKHEPTLLSEQEADRWRRIDFLRRAIDIAADLHSDCVSLWSGILPAMMPEQIAWERLRDGLRLVLAHAQARDVILGFEPEPGMLVETTEQYVALAASLGDPRFQLTIDVGHLHCLGELPIADVLQRNASRLVNIHIEDMRAGVHDHLMFGEGEIDFPPLLAALHERAYEGGVYVELSRHSHAVPMVAKAAFAFLTAACPALRCERAEDDLMA
jgi:L-ribulose-5-phosphate 3-epimerase